MKEPRKYFEAVRNIEEALWTFHAIENSKLNNKIERRHIAVVQTNTILPGRQQLYQEFMCKVLEKGRDADSIVQAVEEGDQQQNPRDYLLNISVSITSHLNTSSVENERKEFVNYLKQELRSLRYQLSSDTLAKHLPEESKFIKMVTPGFIS